MTSRDGQREEGTDPGTRGDSFYQHGSNSLDWRGKRVEGTHALKGRKSNSLMPGLTILRVSYVGSTSNKPALPKARPAVPSLESPAAP